VSKAYIVLLHQIFLSRDSYACTELNLENANESVSSLLCYNVNLIVKPVLMYMLGVKLDITFQEHRTKVIYSIIVFLLYMHYITVVPAHNK
jgi:hypothetical protein